MTNEEFNNGWVAAERDEMLGNGQRKDFPPYRLAEFVEGYRAFWAKQADEIEQAVAECMADYDTLRAR